MVQQMSQNDCELILDYLYRFMQHVGESQMNVTTGPMLSLHDKIIHVHGLGIIINAVSRPDTISSRYPNY